MFPCDEMGAWASFRAVSVEAAAAVSSPQALFALFFLPTFAHFLCVEFVYNHYDSMEHVARIFMLNMMWYLACEITLCVPKSP